MPSIYQMMTNVRIRLGNGLRANAPNEFALLLQVCNHTRNLKRFKRNTGNVWEFNDVIVEVDSSDDTFLINAPDFGTPLAVLTRDEENPSHIVRKIPFFCPQNIAFDWGVPSDSGSYFMGYDGSGHSAQRVSIFWKGNVAYAQFMPKPAYVCEYQFRYLQNANLVGQMALNQEPIPAEDADVVEIRAAKSLLALAEWEDPGTKEGREINAERRKDLIVTLRDDEALAVRQFESAQLVTTGPQMGTRWMDCP